MPFTQSLVPPVRRPIFSQMIVVLQMYRFLSQMTPLDAPKLSQTGTDIWWLLIRRMMFCGQQSLHSNKALSLNFG